MKETLERLFPSDNRAVAPVLGVALLFAIAAIALSAWQTTVIPQQNKEVEFDHYGEVQGDLEDLRTSHLDTVRSGEPVSPTVQLGATYRPRTLGINPPNPRGNLESERLGEFRILNAPDATSDTDVDTVDVCGVENAYSDALRYDPSYNRLSDADTPPIVYDSTVLYRNTTDDEMLVESDQVLIQGSTINILPFRSNASRSGRSTILDLQSQGYLVEKNLEAGAAPTIIVPTEIPASTWENELLDAQMGATPADGSVMEVKGPGATGIDPGEVGIVLNPKGDPFPWTIRCAITSDGDATTDFKEPAKPPQILNDGVGQGGTTEHTAATNRDEMVLVNGKWVEIDDISEIRVGPSDTTQVPNRGGFQGGQGTGLEFKLEDGESDETVYAQVEVTGEPGNWQAKKVKLTTDPSNDGSSKSLTSDAAEKLLDTGRVDILDVDNYLASSFGTEDYTFGSYVETIEAMENATYRTTELHGRVDVQIVSGDLDLTIADDDRTQTYVHDSTSAIDFEVTAEGTTDDTENVDLKVRDSQGQQLSSTSPRVDRQTIELDGGNKTFTMTWEPEWGSLSSGTTYEILVEGESDQALGKVQVLQQGNAYLVVELLDHDETVEYGDDLTATARVTNLGEADTTDTIKLQVEGNCCPSGEASESVEINSTESKTVTLNYDTGALDTDSIGEVELSANSSNTGDVSTANITSPSVIQKPFVEDIPAGEERLNHSMGFTLGEDAGQSTIKIDLADTADDVSHDLNKANWTVVNGSGSINDVNTGDNGGKYVKYETSSSDDRKGDRIVLEADYTDTTGADINSITRYDVTYELTSAGNNLPPGETNSTSFETTRGDDIAVEIVDPGTPVEYGEDLTATVRVKNEGAATGGSDVQLSLAGSSGPEETVEDLTPGESETIEMTYDTGDLDTSSVGDVELEAETSDDTDSQTVTIESPVIHEPYVEDIRAGQERLNHSMGFTLGADTDQAEIKIDLTNTSAAVSHDGDSDGNWTVVEGNGSISNLQTGDNGVRSVTYETHSTDDRAGDQIRIAADYTDTTDADVNSTTGYDVTYELTNANNYPAGETDLTSFETTPGEQIEVEIVDAESPVEYGENLTATVRANNVGGDAGDAQIQLSVDGVTGPRETVQLGSDESTNVTMTYNTSQLSTDSIGDATLEAETSDDTDSQTVTIEHSTLIKEPFVRDIPAGQERLNHSMGFTLGGDTGGATIEIDLTNTSGAVSHDGDSANWTVVEGNGSISLITNNNRVTSVEYQTTETDRAGDEIVLEADYTNTTAANTDSATEYDILYELISKNKNRYEQGETNSTSFETTPP